MKLRSVCTAVLALAALCATAQADTLKKVADSGKITVAYREASVPFSYLPGSGGPVGFAVEMTNAIVDAVKKEVNNPNLKVEMQAVTSQNRIPLLTNGTIDIECGSTTNNLARGKEVQFAINHFYTGTRLLVKKSAGIKNWADVAGKKVASTTGTTNVLVIRKYSKEKNLNFDIVLGKDHDDSMLLVDAGRAEGFAMDDILLYGLKNNARNPAEWDVVADPLQVEPYACMLRKDDPKFKALVDGVIGGMMKSGAFAQLYDKWFMQPIPPKNQALGLPMSQELKDNLTAQSDKALF